MMQKGFLIEEVLIASAFVITVFAGISLLIQQVNIFLAWSPLYLNALERAQEKLENSISVLEKDFYADVSDVVMIDNFTKRIDVTESYLFRGRTLNVSISGMVVNTKESEGQSSCRPNQDIQVWRQPQVSFFDLATIGVNIEPTDIDVVGNYAFISSNTSSASSTDLFIFDVSNPEGVRVISSLDTGPGLSALHVAGEYAYVANTSINSQLQIIDISNKEKPKITASYKVPGLYGTSSPTGLAVFFKNKKVFLGTDKSDVDELYYIDVSSPENPTTIVSEEIGHGVNEVFAFRDKLYVASPHRDELKSYTISSSDLNPSSSYNDPGSTGNGKRLSLFLNTLFLGKTKTINKEELLVLDISTSTSKFSPLFKMAMGASVQGLIGYGKLLFTVVNRATDSFQVFDVGTSTPSRINTSRIDFNKAPTNFDCDKDTFVFVSEGSSVLTFIKPQQI
jgi:hypothetical protein